MVAYQGLWILALAAYVDIEPIGKQEFKAYFWFPDNTEAEYELAGDEAPHDWSASARLLLCSKAKDIGWVEYFDKAAQRYRAARLQGEQLESCIFIGPDFNLPERDWLTSLFEKDALSTLERQSLLSGKPPNQQEDAGRIICACYQVGIKTIQHAIAHDGLDTVEAIGEALKAGTNCGSCVPELHKLLQRH